MRTLHFGLRVSDLARSLEFYTKVGYEFVGDVPETPFGRLTMLKLPGDEFVSLELVHKPGGGPVGPGPHHMVVQVEDIEATAAELAGRGLAVEPIAGEVGDTRVTWLTDPDGNRVEVVQWPPGHPAGLSAADWSGAADAG